MDREEKGTQVAFKLRSQGCNFTNEVAVLFTLYWA